MPIDSSSLIDFIRAIKAQGATDEFTVALLKEKGWSERKIFEGFSQYYEASTGIPIPTRGSRMEAAKDAFSYLLAFITLGTWTTGLGSLLFTLIDLWQPDKLQGTGTILWTRQTLSNHVAAILVAFPVFLLITRAIVRHTRQQPERLESGVRKWLTYIALVITACILIGDAACFLAYLLRGDLTTRFLLKVLSLLILASGVFWYYLASLKQDAVPGEKERWFASAATALVLLTVVLAFFEMGSPHHQRLQALDRRRTADLSMLALGIHEGWSQAVSKGDYRFPKSLDLVSDLPGYGQVSKKDPATGATYSFIPGQGTFYQLCGTFDNNNLQDETVPEGWRHAAGTQCFGLDAARSVTVQPAN